jgi:hypothetical protein
MDIQDRRKIQVDSRQCQFRSGSMTQLMCRIRIVSFTDGGGSGKMGERRRQAMDSAAFLVDGDKRRLCRSALPKAATQRQDLPRRATVMAEQDKSAEGALFERQSFFARQGFTLAADHKHLTDLLPQRFHRAHYNNLDNLLANV